MTFGATMKTAILYDLVVCYIVCVCVCNVAALLLAIQS